METNVVLFTLLVIVSLFVIGLFVIFRKVGVVQHDITNRFDVLSQSSRAIDRLKETLDKINFGSFAARLNSMESKSTDSFADRLASIETNIISKLASIGALSAPEIEKTCNDLLQSTTLGLKDSIESVQYKLSKLDSKISESMSVDGSGIAKINERIESVLSRFRTNESKGAAFDVTIEALKNHKLVDKMENLRSELSVISGTNERILVTLGQLKFPDTEFSLSDMKRLQESIVDKLANVASTNASIKNLSDNIEKLAKTNDATESSLANLIKEHKDLERRIGERDKIERLADGIARKLEDHQTSLRETFLSELQVVNNKDQEALKSLIDTLYSNNQSKLDKIAINEKLKLLSSDVSLEFKKLIAKSAQLQERAEIKMAELVKLSDMDKIANAISEIEADIDKMSVAIKRDGEQQHRETQSKLTTSNDELLGNVRTAVTELSSKLSKEIDDAAIELTGGYEKIIENINASVERTKDLDESMIERVDGLIGELKKWSRTEVKDMLLNNKSELVKWMEVNKDLVLKLQASITSGSLTINDLSNRVGEMTKASTAATKNNENIIKRLAKLETLIGEINERLSKSEEVWLNVKNLNALLQSHSSTTAKDLGDILNAINATKEANAGAIEGFEKRINSEFSKLRRDNDDSVARCKDLQAALDRFEERITEKLIERIKSATDSKELTDLITATMNSKSSIVEKLVKEQTETAKVCADTLARLYALSDTGFAKLNATMTDKLLTIVNEVKEQSNIETVLSYLKTNIPNNEKDMKNVQILIDRLNDANGTVDNTIAKLEEIAKRVTSSNAEIKTGIENASKSNKINNINAKIERINKQLDKISDSVSNETKIDENLKTTKLAIDKVNNATASVNNMITELGKVANRVGAFDKAMTEIKIGVESANNTNEINNIEDKIENINKQLDKLSNTNVASAEVLSSLQSELSNLQDALKKTADTDSAIRYDLELLKSLAPESKYSNKILFTELGKIYNMTRDASLRMAEAETNETTSGKIYESLASKIAEIQSTLDKSFTTDAQHIKDKVTGIDASIEQINKNTNRITDSLIRSDGEIANIKNAISAALPKLLLMPDAVNGLKTAMETYRSGLVSEIQKLTVSNSQNLSNDAIIEAITSLQQSNKEITELMQRLTAELTNDSGSVAGLIDAIENLRTATKRITTKMKNINNGKDAAGTTTTTTEVSALANELKSLEASMEEKIKLLITTIMQSTFDIMGIVSTETINKMKDDIKYIRDKLDNK